MIPLSVPSISGNEWKYVKECLDTEWVSSVGKYVDLFEEKIAEYTCSQYAVACMNGTSALQMSLQIVGVKLGDEVIVPTLSFIAPVNAISYNLAEPVFMDADEYYNIDAEKTIEFIKIETRYERGFTYNKFTGKRISAIILVHVFGNASNMEELAQVCEERNIIIVEDAAESLGTFYSSGNFSGKHTGTIGHLGCLSFNGNKIITTGGGGMILTDDSQLAEKAKYLTTQAKDDELRYIHNEIGYNFRLTNIQAAMGVAQLEQLPKFLKKKKDIYRSYKEGIAGIEGLKIANVPAYSENNHWMILLQIDKEVYGKDRETLMTELKHNGIQTRPVWYPNHLQKPYKDCYTYKIEKAPKLLEKSLCLPASVKITESQIGDVIKSLK
jgi:aminotransferase in exopolysaccharide biosynthesis